MINTLRGKTASLAWIAAVTLVVATPAFSQAPTDAQRSAIRAECRSDYQAHCASIPPGGMASLQCLQKYMSSLSPGCQSAVRAVEAPAETKTELKAEPKTETTTETKTEPKAESAPSTAPAKPVAAEPATAPAPKAAAGTAAKKPSSAQVAAIRSACRSDYQQNCAGVPTGGAPALQCLEKNKSKLSASCQKAVTAASDGGASPASGGAPSAAAVDTPAATPAETPAPALVLRPMRPREELFVLRSACGGDVRALCGGIQPGGGRIMQCLAAQAAALSPVCKDVLGQFAAQ